MKKAIVLIVLLLFSHSLYGENYTIETFIDRVQANSNDLKLVRQDKEKSKAITDEAWASALPKVFAQVDYKRNMKDTFLYMDMPDMTGGTTEMKIKMNKKNEYAFQVVLSQPLYSRKVGAALTAASQYEKLSEHIYQTSEETILIAAKKEFYRGMLLKNVWEVTKMSEQQAKDNYLQIKTRFKGGIASEFEMLQAEISWKNEIPKVTESRRNYQLLLANLKILAGIPSDEAMELEGDFAHYPPYPKKIDTSAILADRSDYQAILMERDLKETDVSAQKSDHWPTLDANLIYAYNAASDEQKMENENESVIAGLTLSIPIFSGGYTSAQVKKSSIELSKAHINAEKTRREIEAEVSNIYVRLTEAEQRILSAKTTRKTAEKAYNIGKVQSENGLITQLQLRDARIFLEQAHLNYYSAVFDYLSAYLDWQKATGQVRK